MAKAFVEGFLARISASNSSRLAPCLANLATPNAKRPNPMLNWPESITRTGIVSNASAAIRATLLILLKDSEIWIEIIPSAPSFAMLW